MYAEGKFVFIHNARTGGTSLGDTLAKYITHKYPVHTSAADILYDIGADNFFSVPRFTVVRNSWDRIHSLYYQIGNRQNSLDEFIEEIYIGSVPWSCSQLALICNTNQYFGYMGSYRKGRFKHAFLIDKVFYYKKCMLDEVGQYLGLTLTFNPHHNFSHGRPDYRDVYTAKGIRMVRELYADEIDIFRFKFDE